VQLVIGVVLGGVGGIANVGADQRVVLVEQRAKRGVRRPGV
jgi:hypothetical protein